MVAVKIGCCGFAGRRENYFKKYPVIEVEQTFFDPPRVFTGEKWRREAPDDFEFTVRAWQLITHERTSPTYRRMQTRMNPKELEGAGHFQSTPVVWQAWQRTHEIATALRARTILFHCPDTFAPDAENQDRLRRFFERVRQETQAGEFNYAWEPPGTWPDEDVAELSGELGLVHAVDPFATDCLTSGKCYFRLHGIKGYRHHHTEEELQRLIKLLGRFEGGYCLFHNLHMREDASRLTWMLQSSQETAAEQSAA